MAVFSCARRARKAKRPHSGNLQRFIYFWILKSCFCGFVNFLALVFKKGVCMGHFQDIVMQVSSCSRRNVLYLILLNSESTIYEKSKTF